MAIDPQALTNALAALPAQTLQQVKDALGKIAPDSGDMATGRSGPTIIDQVPEGYDGPTVHHCDIATDTVTIRPFNEDELAQLAIDQAAAAERDELAAKAEEQRAARLEVIRKEAATNPAIAALATELGLVR